MAEAPGPSTTPPLEIAHVLFMDIVAYSTLHMDRQQQLLHDLQEAVRSTPTFARAQAQDQLIRLPTGDGMALVFFQDPEAPVRCALELTKILRNHPDIQLRMGIHTGPVYRVADINANRNVAGGGINIAQRVMDCGDAGHILVSSAEAEVLGQVSAWCPMLHDLGEVEVKHGVLIHLYNLDADQSGNPELPKKIAASRRALVQAASGTKRKTLPLMMVGTGVALVALATMASWLLHAHRPHALGTTDTIVVADFLNMTDEPVFDGALRQALAAELRQSPFLSVIDDGRQGYALTQMGRPLDAPMTLEIYRELCQHLGSVAVLQGSIANIGSQYDVAIQTVGCRDGNSWTQERVRAVDKEHVLVALDKAALNLRQELGEPRSTLYKFHAPVGQSTSPSIEGLQAYGLGWTAFLKGDSAAAVRHFQRAVQLDPNFALAYLELGSSYENLGEQELAKQNIQSAYDLRGHLSERDKFYVEGWYHMIVTGDLEEAQRVLDSWAQTYPRDSASRWYTQVIYQSWDKSEKGLAAARQKVASHPESDNAYADLIKEYLDLNQVDGAINTAREAQAKKIDSPYLRIQLYRLAFVQNDTDAMARYLASVTGKPGPEDELLADEAETVAYAGRLRTARELSRRAVASAERMGGFYREQAAEHEAHSAMREALFGNATEARQHAQAALGISKYMLPQCVATLAIAFTGEIAPWQSLTDDLSKRFQHNTVVQFAIVPTIRAQLAINHKDFSKAIEFLHAAAPYEMSVGLYPVYVRGMAYLGLHRGSEAVAEFQEILEQRGVVWNGPIGALAHLQLGRAYVMSGDTAKARAAYQDFLNLWKDADPDIPILREAKAEYAKLQ